MENLSQYLKKFKLLVSTNEENAKIIQAVISDTVDVVIPLDDLYIKNGVIFIKTKSIIKNEIAMRKKQILKEFVERGVKNITDLR